MQDGKGNGRAVISGSTIQNKVPMKGIPGVGPSGTFHSCAGRWGLLGWGHSSVCSLHFGLGFLSFSTSLSLLIHSQAPVPGQALVGRQSTKKCYIAL